MITLPYVTTASFKAYPTFLDVMNLRTRDYSAEDQDDELFNILLKSSSWADSYTEMGAGTGTLAAHSRTENARLRVARDGRISYHANHVPVTAITGLKMGASPNQLVAIADLSNLWIEDQRQIVGYPGGATAPGMNALQFGTPAISAEAYTQWTYTAGFANTVLASVTAAAATNLPVLDATGITAGSVLRIWDPGNEEAVTVAPSYAGGLSLPLVAPLKFAHDPTPTPVGVSGLPADIHLAVILYAAGLLQRPDSDAEDTYPATTMRPNSAVGNRHDGSGFVVEAMKLLEPYRRIQ